MKKTVFHCDCGINGTKPVGRPHPTEVDKDDICVHCGHYAQAKPLSDVKHYIIVTDLDTSPEDVEHTAHIDLETLEVSDT